jgi:peptidase E
MNANTLPAPILLLAGSPGSRSQGRDPVLADFLQSCRLTAPAIAYIGAASGDNPSFYDWGASYWMRSGAGRVDLVPLCGRRRNPERAAAILAACHLVFVSGGDVDAGMQGLAADGFDTRLRNLYAAGIPFCGLSAGSIMLGRQWIRWTDPDNDASAELFDCLGLAPLICDTHAEDDDWEELRALLRLAGPGAEGYGIPGGAALRLERDGRLIGIGPAIFCHSHETSGVSP